MENDSVIEMALEELMLGKISPEEFVIRIRQEENESKRPPKGTDLLVSDPSQTNPNTPPYLIVLEKLTAKEFDEKFKPGAVIMTGFEPFEDVSHTMLYLVQTMAKLRDEYQCKPIIICADAHSSLHAEEINSVASYKLWKLFGFEPKLASEFTKNTEYQTLFQETSEKVRQNHALKGFPKAFRQGAKNGTAPQEEVDNAIRYVRMEITDFRYFKPDIFIGGMSQRKYITVSRDRIYKQTGALIPPAMNLRGEHASFYRTGTGLINLNSDAHEEIKQKIAQASELSIADIQKRIFNGTRDEITQYFCQINSQLLEDK